jgi:hypothetical protein
MDSTYALDLSVLNATAKTIELTAIPSQQQRTADQKIDLCDVFCEAFAVNIPYCSTVVLVFFAHSLTPHGDCESAHNEHVRNSSEDIKKSRRQPTTSGAFISCSVWSGLY